MYLLLPTVSVSAAVVPAGVPVTLNGAFQQQCSSSAAALALALCVFVRFAAVVCRCR